MFEEKSRFDVRGIRYEWRTYEVRLKDMDGNEIVIAEI